MVRIAPVRLALNPKTLWFDARDLELKAGDAVLVTTARGTEFGHMAQDVFEADYEQTKKLKSPLKPVQGLASDEDVAHADEMMALSLEALPVFRRLAGECQPDMNPIAVEYLFDGSKAVFYFDADERVDFRDLVRKLAAELHVRVDMKQIGVRDGARMVGGLGHCGQELCCARLGGEFNPVSIRMAKEQDLSLNPQKISGICGRLMCCLRYEYDAYKDFHSRAPKKNARVQTPDGEGKVVDLDVPREIVYIKVGNEKPVKVPLADMDEPAEGERPKSVGEEAWEQANKPVVAPILNSSNLFTTQLSGDDKLAEPGKVTHTGSSSSQKPSRSRSRRRGGKSAQPQETVESASTQRKPRRRRSTTVASDGSTKTSEQPKQGAAHSEEGKHAADQQAKSSRRRSRGSRGSGRSKQQGQQGASTQQQGKSVQVGRNSSALRSNRDAAAGAGSENTSAHEGAGRRRRRSHRTGAEGGQAPSAE